MTSNALVQDEQTNKVQVNEIQSQSQESYDYKALAYDFGLWFLGSFAGSIQGPIGVISGAIAGYQGGLVGAGAGAQGFSFVFVRG